MNNWNWISLENEIPVSTTSISLENMLILIPLIRSYTLKLQFADSTKNWKKMNFQWLLTSLMFVYKQSTKKCLTSLWSVTKITSHKNENESSLHNTRGATKEYKQKSRAPSKPRNCFLVSKTRMPPATSRTGFSLHRQRGWKASSYRLSRKNCQVLPVIRFCERPCRFAPAVSTQKSQKKSPLSFFKVATVLLQKS